MENNTMQQETEERVIGVGHSVPAVTARRRPNLPRLLAIILVAGLAGYLGSWCQNYVNNGTITSLPKMSAKDDGNNIVTASEESIASVAKKASGSVVSILTSSKQLSFFSQEYEQQAAGTGMIVSKDGYVLTNKHVVDKADSVTVITLDGKTYKNVEVLGTDPLNDIAFLKINDVTNLPAISMGDSKTIRIGQTVVAIGNALGQYQNTVTSGIISGIGRPVVAGSQGGSSTESLSDLLQTDAAINSGNSGGPLLNLKGQVIGINTAIAADAQGIGFSIPIGAAKGMLAHLIKTGKLQRPYLGIQYVPITPATKETYKLSVTKGDYIHAATGPSVQKNGPADKSGVKDKDIITKVNGVEVDSGASVSTLISEYKPGDTVQLTIIRGTKTITVNATLGVYSR
jgi:serine protease Do